MIGGVNLAVIDMSGKWNIRISAIKINNTNFPIIEVFFQLDSPLQLGDQLDFGSSTDFGRDLQIRLNSLSDSYYLISAIYQRDSGYSLSSVTITDDHLSLVQSVTNNSYGQTSTLQLNYDSKRIGICSQSITGSAFHSNYSPMSVLHDMRTDKIIAFQSSTQGAVFSFTSVNPDAIIPTITDVNGIGASNYHDVPIGAGSISPIIIDFIDNELYPLSPDDSDPYNPNNEPAGGGGEEQNTDDMADETLPTISVADTGFVTLYKPSISQMNSLASYMWGTFDVDAFKKVFANPMDVILGLSILPGIVPAGGSSSVMVGNINTGISMTKVANQYVKFDCGSVTIKRRWGAFLDYSPYTKAFIYLPFIGVEPIDVDEIMNKTVSVTYNIDVLSGGCCAFIKVDGTTLYSYIGQCACSVPVTGKDWSTMINGVLGAVSGITGTIGSLASGNVAGAVSGIASVAQNVAGAKPTYQRSGSMGGMGGMMGIKTPYIIIERPVQAVPGYQNQIIGYPSFITRLIGDFKGYTEIEQCHLENIPCTGEELIEIENILKSGVIL